MIVRWPGRTTGGQQSQALVGLQDIYATLAQALTLTVQPGEGLDSVSFLPVLHDPQAPGRKGIIHHSLDGTFAVRQGPWKLIEGNLGSGGFSRPSRVEPGPDDPGGQLYNLNNDPAETTNLWKEFPERVVELQALLAAARKLQ